MSEMHEAAGSYALDALDPAETAEFEAHLATCATCRDEVAEFGETAAELSLLSLASPPPGLRSSILTAIQDLPQLPPEDDETLIRPVVPLRPASVRKGSGPRRALPGSEIPDEPEAPPVDELAVRRQRRGNRVLSGLVAAMLALALGLGGVVYSLVQQRQAQVATQTLEQQLYQAPDAKTSTVNLEGGGQVTFIASKQLNRALFIGTDLPNPGTDRYQLWTGKGNPAGTITGIARDAQIGDTRSGVKVYFTGDVATSDFLAVNLEPAGSTPDAPTNDPLAAGVI